MTDFLKKRHRVESKHCSILKEAPVALSNEIQKRGSLRAVGDWRGLGVRGPNGICCILASHEVKMYFHKADRYGIKPVSTFKNSDIYTDPDWTRSLTRATLARCPSP